MPATPAWPPKSLPRLFVAGPLGPGIGVELETQADLPKSDGHLLIDAERATEIEFALGEDGAGAGFDGDPDGDGLETGGLAVTEEHRSALLPDVEWLAGVSGVMVVVAAIACFVPAWRADSRVTRFNDARISCMPSIDPGEKCGVCSYVKYS